jgi:hypothetical protein
MGSLKAFLPQLSKIVGSTPDALYSRQRALVENGVLKATKGRGPGSGVALSGEAVAAMIIALLAADSLQDTDQRVKLACLADPEEGSACPWTGAATFQSALAAVLTDEDRSKMLHFVSMARGTQAWMAYGSLRSGHKRPTTFAINRAGRHQPVVNITARIESKTLSQVSKALRTELGDSA